MCAFSSCAGNYEGGMLPVEASQGTGECVCCTDGICILTQSHFNTSLASVFAIAKSVKNIYALWDRAW